MHFKSNFSQVLIDLLRMLLQTPRTLEQVSVRFLQFHLPFADPWCYHQLTLTQLADVGIVPELNK